MNILYVGSGNSSREVSNFRRNVTTCAVNNAWRLFPSGELDYWIYPGDFPLDRMPDEAYQTNRIGYKEYVTAAPLSVSAVGVQSPSPLHWIGYTICFQGLHWIMHNLKPERIYTLGFDHDYNPDKVKKWMESGCPAPNNLFMGSQPKDVIGWANEFFGEMKEDSFYGHGTPDPFRLPEQEISLFFDRAKQVADVLGIKLFNLSSNKGLNTFEHAHSIT